MILVQSYGAINQDVQQFGLRMWSWSGDAGVAVATVDSPPIMVAGMIYKPGAASGAVYKLGAQKGMMVSDA